jgi:hypothetical protein
MADIVNSPYEEDDKLYGKRIKAVPKPPTEIGIDTDNKFFDNIAGAAMNNVLDLGAFNSFTNASNSRDSVYKTIDTMCQDATIAAILETYTEDATEYNDEGNIVWVESSDTHCRQYVQNILDTMRVDKNIFNWAASLCKYGDLYLKLCRQSDYAFDHLFDNDTSKKVLKEDVKVKASSKSDHFTGYLEKISNPAEVFELTKFGKTYAYARTHINSSGIDASVNPLLLPNNITSYRFKKSDVDIYPATDFVHATLEETSNRSPEEVKIYLNETDTDTDLTYSVKRGQSIFYNIFKIWREISLLESSIMLNRITKSSIVRLINVEVGDMSKEDIIIHLQKIKAMIEQKAAIDTGKSMSEYTNPGPIENNIYIPTHEGKGAITTSEFGGDVNVGQLTDLDYFKNKFFGAMRVPKQFFGDTDDGAGFNGGTSLSIISSRYAKAIKRIQNALIQAITDAVNIMLIDKEMDSYVNKFTIKMLPPTTQEEIDRRDNLSNKISIASDIMQLISQDIDNQEIKLRALKSLLNSTITNAEILELIQEQIDTIMSEQGDEQPDESLNDMSDTEFSDSTLGSFGNLSGSGTSDGGFIEDEFTDANSDVLNIGNDSEIESEISDEEPDISPASNELPTADELGVDMTDNNLEM